MDSCSGEYRKGTVMSNDITKEEKKFLERLSDAFPRIADALERIAKAMERNDRPMTVSKKGEITRLPIVKDRHDGKKR